MAVKLLGENIAMCKLSDFATIMNNVDKYNHVNNSKEYFRNAINGYSSWDSDPDNAPTMDRLSGRFPMAQEIMQKTKIEALGGNVQSLMPEFEFGLLDGTEVDFDQYMIHNPRCMGRVNMVTPGDRCIKIAVGIGGNAGLSREVLISRAASIMRVIFEYEEAGYQVECYAFYGGTHCTRESKLEISMVDCTEATSGQILSAMSSARVARTCLFGLQQHLPGASRNCSIQASHSQYGHNMQRVSNELRKYLGNDLKVIHAGASVEQMRKDLK